MLRGRDEEKKLDKVLLVEFSSERDDVYGGVYIYLSYETCIIFFMQEYNGWSWWWWNGMANKQIND